MFESYIIIHWLMLLCYTPFMGYIFWTFVIPLCQYCRFPGYLYHGVFPEITNTPFLYGSRLRVREVNVNWSHNSIMKGQMLFCEMVWNIFFSWFPKYVKVALFDTVPYLVEPYVDDSRAFFLTYSINYSACCWFLCCFWFGLLLVSHFC